MKSKSLKSNFIYNLVLKLANLVFPLVTFPYVARILTPTGVGKYDFAMAIVSYFLIFAQLGIPIYAVRECAKVREDLDRLSKTVQEILIINTLSALFTFIIFIVVIFGFSFLEDYKIILLILSGLIFTMSFGAEWFFQAIEDYKFITVRSIIIKILSLVAIFLFVKSENDLILYTLIIFLSSSIGYAYNFSYLLKKINLIKKYRDYNFRKHMKPILLLFLMSISVSIYINLDKVMLGFLTSDYYVGLYTAANKVIKVILALVTSLATILLPRMSYYVEKKDFNNINKLIEKSLNFIILLALPSTIGIMILAEPITLLFAGKDYLNSIRTMIILSPVIIAIALSNLIGIQILIPFGLEKITILSTMIGAIFNFTFNYLLIPHYLQNGAAIGTVIAEFVVVLVQLIFALKYIRRNIPYKSILAYIFGTLLIAFICLGLKIIVNDSFLLITLSLFMSAFIYFLFLYILKNEIVYIFVNTLFKRVFSKFKKQ